MNILVHTWVFSKYKGSEFAVAYNFVKEMSKRHHLYVLVESNALEWNDLSEFNGGGYNELTNVDFITVPYENKIILFLCYKFSWWFKYFLYKAWERGVYRYIKKSGLLEKIDLIHYAAPVGYREPGFLHKFGKPYVWGPFGGMYQIPREFIREAPVKTRLVWRMKNLLNAVQFHSPRIKHVLKRADVLIACTKTQQDMVNHLLKKDVCRYLPENGIDYEKQQAVSDDFIERKFSERCVNVLWIGRNDINKNTRLLLDSLAKCTAENFRCTFVGEGCADLVAHVQDEQLLSRLSFSDSIPREKVLEMYKEAHLLVITSAMEANTTVLFEALENCVPVMTVDHCGMADVVQHENTGIKIPVSDYETMCASFASQIDRVCKDIGLLKMFARNIKSSSYEYSHEYRMNFFEKCYADALSTYKAGVAR